MTNDLEGGLIFSLEWATLLSIISTNVTLQHIHNYYQSPVPLLCCITNVREVRLRYVVSHSNLYLTWALSTLFGRKRTRIKYLVQVWTLGPDFQKNL